MADLAAALPEYELLGELGRGAMGVVLAARHRSLGRPVAIKELPAAFAVDASIRTRFLHEAQTVAGLSHPHIVSVFDFVDRDGHLALIMEQLSGGTVWDRFTGRGVTVPVACALLLSTAAGLDHAHRHGVLHRDVKPENLMFTADGLLKVTDFGMAKVMGGEKTLATADGVVLGTPAYMAPEQAEGAAVGPPADVYACGTMLFELVSGRLPFAAAPTPMAMLVRRIAQDSPPLAEVAPAVAPEIASVVDRALVRSIDERYQAVGEFATALGAAASHTWGPDWLASTGVRVTGSEQIEAAARGEHSTGPDGPVGDHMRSSGRHGRSAPPTVLDASAASGADANATLWPEGRESVAPDPATAAPVVVAHQPHRQPAPDLSQISLTQVVDIAQVSQTRKPMVPALASVTLALGLLAVAFVGAGYPTPDREVAVADGDSASTLLLVDGQSAIGAQVDVDFSQPFIVEGLGEGSIVRLEASTLGIPLGVTDATLQNGRAEFNPEYLRWTTAGVVDLDLVVDDGPDPRATVAATAVQPWVATAPFVAAVLLGLFALVSIHAHARGLRGAGFRPLTQLGLIVHGALAGLSVVALGIMANAAALTIPLLAVGAGLAVGSSVLLGEAHRRRHRPRGFTVVVS